MWQELSDLVSVFGALEDSYARLHLLCPDLATLQERGLQDPEMVFYLHAGALWVPTRYLVGSCTSPKEEGLPLPLGSFPSTFHNNQPVGAAIAKALLLPPLVAAAPLSRLWRLLPGTKPRLYSRDATERGNTPLQSEQPQRVYFCGGRLLASRASV